MASNTPAGLSFVPQPPHTVAGMHQPVKQKPSLSATNPGRQGGGGASQSGTLHDLAVTARQLQSCSGMQGQPIWGEHSACTQPGVP